MNHRVIFASIMMIVVTGAYTACLEPEPDDGDCVVEDCGTPVLGSYVCPDGSLGGSTGRCIRNEDEVCAWEIRECPDTDTGCEPDDCGPEPRLPTLLCEDGTLGGFTGNCLPDEEGGCYWEIRECDYIECDVARCGPEPGVATWECPDGSLGGFTGRCVTDTDGRCGWEIRECPDGDVTP